MNSNILPFLGQHEQITAYILQGSRDHQIAELGIYVEWAIGRIQNYRILQGVLPLALFQDPIATKVDCWILEYISLVALQY